MPLIPKILNKGLDKQPYLHQAGQVTSNKRPERANQILKYLMEIHPKAMSRAQIAAHFKWNESAVQRSMPILTKTGVVHVDRTRSPEYFSWVKGSNPNIWPLFEFKDAVEKEINVRGFTEKFLSETKDWRIPQRTTPNLVILAALYGMEMDPSDREKYEEWLRAIAAKLRPHYLAYRIIKTIQEIPDRNRRLEIWGINSKQPGQSKDDEMSMTILFSQMLKQLLEDLQ